MCGIIGVVASKDALSRILRGLSKLEYRGYDSSGVAMVDGDKLCRYREVGRLNVLVESLVNKVINSGCGIGHTRWATHGAPSICNAHPHCDMEGIVAVVHNGIIENYADLVEELKADNVVLSSQTDTEVVAQMLGMRLRGVRRTESEVLKAILDTTQKLRGTFALGVVVGGLNSVFGTKRCSPMILGKSKNAVYMASDTIALEEDVNSIAYVDDGDICVLNKDGIRVYDKYLVDKNVVFVDKCESEIDDGKGNYQHYMQKEIDECNVSLVKTLENVVSVDKKKLTQLVKCEEIHIVACGTALNAGKVLKEWLRVCAGVNAVVMCASEYRYSMPNVPNGGVGIVISQSGETADTIGSMECMRNAGMKLVGITNVCTSQIARMVDVNIPTKAGKELAVASTKAYVAQLGALYYLGQVISESRGKKEKMNINTLIDIAGKNDIDYYQKLSDIVEELCNSGSIYIVGRGLDCVIAEEVALKIKEVSYIHCEAMPMGELKHGSLALISQGSKVIVILTQSNLVDKVESNIREIMARGGQVLLVTNKIINIQVWKRINLPNVEDIYAPIVAIRPMQQLAYLLAITKGNDPDKPRNLAKSVTVE